MAEQIYLRQLEYLSNLINFKVLKKRKYSPSHSCQRQPIPHHEAKFSKAVIEKEERKVSYKRIFRKF